MFKNSHDNSINIDLRNVILIDSQSTMDLFCNPNLVGNIYKAKKNMRLQSNGGKILITHKSQVAGYKIYFCFKKIYITNLIALNNLNNQYPVTYDILDEIFITHRK